MKDPVSQILVAKRLYDGLGFSEARWSFDRRKNELRYDSMVVAKLQGAAWEVGEMVANLLDAMLGIAGAAEKAMEKRRAAGGGDA